MPIARHGRANLQHPLALIVKSRYFRSKAIGKLPSRAGWDAIRVSARAQSGNLGARLLEACLNAVTIWQRLLPRLAMPRRSI